MLRFGHSVWKNIAFEFSNFGIFHQFWPIQTDLSGNSVWPQAVFKNSSKWPFLAFFEINFSPLKMKTYAMLNETFSVIFKHRAFVCFWKHSFNRCSCSSFCLDYCCMHLWLHLGCQFSSFEGVRIGIIQQKIFKNHKRHKRRKIRQSLFTFWHSSADLHSIWQFFWPKNIKILISPIEMNLNNVAILYKYISGSFVRSMSPQSPFLIPLPSSSNFPPSLLFRR